MQLILDTEPTLGIEKDMSAVGDINFEKVVNGDIEQLDAKKLNGNKENLGEVNNDDLNKQVINTEVDADLPIDIKLKPGEEKSSNGDAIKEQTREVNNHKANGAQTEESQKNDPEEEFTMKIESDEESEQILQEDAEKKEKQDIGVPEEISNQIEDIVEKAFANLNKKTDDKINKEELLNTKDDIEIIEEPSEIHSVCESIPDEESKESETTETRHLEFFENKDKQLDDNKDVSPSVTPDPVSKKTISNIDAHDSSPIELKDDMDVEEVVEAKTNKQDTASQVKEAPLAPVNSIIDKPIICKLSNTLDILSDDEEEPPKEEPPKKVDSNEKLCINIEDDDDIMVIDEDTSKTETLENVDISNKEEVPIISADKTDSETGEKALDESIDLFAKTENKDSTPAADIDDTSSQINISEKQEETKVEKSEPDLPLLPDNFLKSAKKNLSDMTRDDLEEFCILKIVESIVDRSNLSEIKNKLKSMAQGIEEYRKKAMMLTKQNRDLQVVLKSIQEEQKKMTPDTPITPLKITRSVGMQVFMEKSGVRRKNLQNPANNNQTRQNAKSLPGTSPRLQKPAATNQPIPVPRLVPANTPAMKSPSTIPLVNQITPGKTVTPIPNGIKNPSPSQKVGEKRQHNRIMSVTVDLTDDEPPTKINNRTSPAPPVRVVPSQNLMANPRQPFPTAVSSPRKVYIPISGPQNQGLRSGQTIMLKSVPTPGLRPRGPNPQVARMPGAVRMNRLQTGRHPAPLPDAMKQYQPPNWKALPPAPDLKLSKVENGIVISWKIEGYQEDSYEEIASYQLYAYQETSSPPSTALWKKIGDVKALPLPMACTLTQFMAGFKYYFAVRAVDIRSRLGPFSLPGSILLLNKL